MSRQDQIADALTRIRNAHSETPKCNRFWFKAITRYF